MNLKDSSNYLFISFLRFTRRLLGIASSYIAVLCSIYNLVTYYYGHYSVFLEIEKCCVFLPLSGSLALQEEFEDTKMGKNRNRKSKENRQDKQRTQGKRSTTHYNED